MGELDSLRGRLTRKPAEMDLAALHLQLLRGKTWRYLRYLHLREYLQRVSGEIRTVCICGAGRGTAEIALAIEFPRLHFTMTDIIAEGYPNYHRAMQFAWRKDIDNVAFSIWDVLQPTKRRFDLVCSTEMLEHIEDDDLAAKNMRTAASRYVYCLAPFADDATNADEAKRKAHWEKNRHYVCGYNPARLEKLFGRPMAIAGAYWADHGGKLRAKLEAMTPEEIAAQSTVLMQEAEADLQPSVPTERRQAVGIKVLVERV